MSREFQILLIGESEHDSRLIEDVLRKASIPYRLTVTDLRRTCEELKALGPTDLILFNHIYCIEDGLPILSEIKNDPQIGNIPLIVLSPRPETEQIAGIRRPKRFNLLRDLLITMHAGLK